MKKIDLDNSLTTDFLVKLNKAREDKEERAYFQEVNIDAISATTAVMLLNAVENALEKAEVDGTVEE